MEPLQHRKGMQHGVIFQRGQVAVGVQNADDIAILVELVALGGTRTVYGINGLVNGKLK